MGYWKWLADGFRNVYSHSLLVFLLTPLLTFLVTLYLMWNVHILFMLLVPFGIMIGWSYAFYLMENEE